jgi:hypothetical protein
MGLLHSVADGSGRAAEGGEIREWKIVAVDKACGRINLGCRLRGRWTGRQGAGWRGGKIMVEGWTSGEEAILAALDGSR